MKSKSTAYILWFFLGVLGAHKFYLNKTGIGVLYFFTLGLAGIGWLIDLFTLSRQVVVCNAGIRRKAVANNRANAVANAPAGNNISQPSLFEQLHELHKLFEKGIISEEEYDAKKSKIVG